MERFREKAHERRLVRFLSEPGHYPHPAQAISHRQTHISHVFLAGSFAYKLKKPIRFPFLDASTLALREKWCHLEVKLNRRLSPDLYLGVVPVVDTPEGLRIGGRGRVVEWLVRMRRLPEDRMLDRLIQQRKVGARDLEWVGVSLSRFFKRAPRSRRIDRSGKPQRVGALVLQNLEECRLFSERLVTKENLDFIGRALRRFLLLHEPTLRKRVAHRRMIDGHGDLRCENICLTDPVTLFDCVEFEPKFRRGDVASDLAFLLMDLEFRHRPDLARVVLRQYRAGTLDLTVDSVLPFYQCYRSLVRAKVRGLAWLQHPGGSKGRHLRRMAQRHFELARQYAQRFDRPLLIVVGGAIGTGKSTLARHLADRLEAAWLRTDEIRLKEFGPLPRSGFLEGLYAPSISQKVYRRLIDRAEGLIKRGSSVICDGTFSKAENRRELWRIAQRHGALFHFFECTLPTQKAKRRIGARLAARVGLSEARPEFYDRIKARFEPERRLPQRDWTRLSTSGSPASTFRTAIQIIQRRMPAVPSKAGKGSNR